MLESFDPRDPEGYQNFFSPGAIDSQLRSLIQMCWMSLPDDKKTLDELEKIFRALVDRSFTDLREDRDTFGLPG